MKLFCSLIINILYRHILFLIHCYLGIIFFKFINYLQSTAITLGIIFDM